MSRGKKEPAIPFATSVEVEAGRGKTVANGGQEDRCDGADVPHGGLRIDRGQAGPATCSSARVCRKISAVTRCSSGGGGSTTTRFGHTGVAGPSQGKILT